MSNIDRIPFLHSTRYVYRPLDRVACAICMATCNVDRIRPFYITKVMFVSLSIEWDMLYAWPRRNEPICDVGPVCIYAPPLRYREIDNWT